MLKNIKIWTEEEIQILKDWYPDTSTSELAILLNATKRAVYHKAGLLGLRKTEAYLNAHGGRLMGQTGKENRFKKGHVPFNKNKKVTEYMDEAQIQRMLKTSYQKGHVPHNAKEGVGIISQRTDKGGKPFLVIKLGMGEWEYLSVHNYKKHIGPVPKGYCVCFKDGNTLNCEPENLMLLTRKENILRNSITNLPPELRESIKMINKLNKTINQIEKKYGTK